jgi:tRNA-specific 2-thiouridylase
MSGGVDSLRTAALLTEEGHEVIGVHMRLLPKSKSGIWCAESVNQDREVRVKTLAKRLSLPLHIIDLREAFEQHVITPFIEGYQQGITPNPCTTCNPIIKFGLLLKESLRLGADRLATGHYVRVSPPDFHSDRYRLHRASDNSKDQSYFLFGLLQEQLASVLFPLGDLFKSDVVNWAIQHGYEIPAESQEICFVPSGKYMDFLVERIDCKSPSGGPIVDEEGRVLGEHKGIFAYTVGQRRGLGIASTAPYYVLGLDPSTNTIQVGRVEALFRSEFEVDSVNWVSMAPPEGGIRCEVRIRHQHRPSPAVVTVIDRERVAVKFDKPQKAVTPGQAAVFYEGDLVLGGGIIVKS